LAGGRIKGKRVADPVFSDLATVVIPAFDAAATIDEALRSIRLQIYRHLDFIVAGDVRHQHL
jgi:hypothetical protein